MSEARGEPSLSCAQSHVLSDKQNPLGDFDLSAWERQRHEEEVLAVARANHWPLVDVRHSPPVSTADVVLAIVSPANLGAAEGLMKRARQAAVAAAATADESKRVPPIVAVLLRAEWPEEHASILKVQRDLISQGFSDVVVKEVSGGREEFELAVGMGLVRAEGARTIISELEEARQRLEELEGQGDQEPGDGMFWQCAHRLFKGIPELDEDIPCELEEGQQVGPCRLRKLIGKGGFGTVFAAEDLEEEGGGRMEAVKVVNKGGLQNLVAVNVLNREIRLLSALDHDHVVRFKGTFQGPEHVCIRMELAGPRNLARRLREAGGCLDVDVARGYQAQLAGAVAHCHDRGVAHRDLKPENIVVSQDSSQITVVDFGTVASTRRPCHDMVGTMPFVAPEILMVHDTDKGYNAAWGDVWASAVVLLEMLCGMGKVNRMLRWEKNVAPRPNRGSDLLTYFSRAGAVKEALLVEFLEVDSDIVDLLTGMLEPDVERRLSAEKVEDHTWLRQAAA